MAFTTSPQLNKGWLQVLGEYEVMNSRTMITLDHGEDRDMEEYLIKFMV